MQIECRAGMSNWGTLKAWAASWPFASGRPWAFGGWGGGVGGWGGEGGGGGGGGGGGHPFFFFFFFFLFLFLFASPPPLSPSVLFAYSFTLPPCLPHPFSSPIRKTPDCHACNISKPGKSHLPQNRAFPLLFVHIKVGDVSSYLFR